MIRDILQSDWFFFFMFFGTLVSFANLHSLYQEDEFRKQKNIFVDEKRDSWKITSGAISFWFLLLAAWYFIYALTS